MNEQFRLKQPFEVTKSRMIEVPTIILMDLADILNEFDTVLNGLDPIEILNMLLSNVLSDSPRDSMNGFLREMCGFCWFNDIQPIESEKMLSFLQYSFDYILNNIPPVWAKSMTLLGYHVTNINAGIVTIEAGANYEHYLTGVHQLKYEPQ